MPDATTNLVALTIPRPDEDLFKRSERWLQAAQAAAIATPAQAEAAAVDLREIKALAKDLEERRTAITGPINQALRQVNDLFKPAKDWLAQAETTLKGKLLSFQQEQERAAREAQARAEEEIRQRREKLEQEAAKAEARGKEAKADVLRAQAQAEVAPAIQPVASSLPGIQSRETWKAEVTDIRALLTFVVETWPALAATIEVNQGVLNAQARTMREALAIPGVRAVKETTLAARRAR